MAKLDIELDLSCVHSAVSIINRARKAMLQADDPDIYDNHWKVFYLEATGGDYAYLINTCKKWFKVKE